MQVYIFTLFLLLVLTSCATDLPGEPTAPDLVGNYYRPISNWVSDSQHMSLATTQNTLEITVKADLTYSKLYIWNEVDQKWNPFTFEQNPFYGEWIADKATLTITDSLQNFANINDEIFVIAFSCNKQGSSWDCNNNKWGLDIVKISNSSKQNSDPSKPSENIYHKSNLFEWYPSSNHEIKPNILVSPLAREDFNMGGTVVSQTNTFMKTFTGNDAILQQKFKEDFFKKPYLQSDAEHPDCVRFTSPNILIHTFSKPYEFLQNDFITWLEQNTEKADFLAPNARRFSQYYGNQKCPLSNNHISQTFGSRITANDEVLTLAQYNRHNPLRWFAPLNYVHAHEASSLFAMFQVKDTEKGEIHKDLNSYDSKIILQYAIDISVTSNQHIENSIYDYYGSRQIPDSLLGNIHSSIYSNACVGSTIPKEQCKYMQERLLPSWAHVSLAINFREANNFNDEEDRWRTQSLILASTNSYKYPFSSEYRATDNAYINSINKDGRNNGRGAWTRFPIDGLQSFKGIVLNGGDHEIIRSVSSRAQEDIFSSKGVIDVTEYYRTSKENSFFPGQHGYWLGKAVGFDVPGSSVYNPNEKHTLNWIAVLFEAHGLYDVKVDIRNFNLFSIDRDDCYAYVWDRSYLGKHNVIGLSKSDSTDDRFICYHGTFYSCGWELDNKNLASSVQDGQKVGSFTCDLESSSWI